RREAAHEVPARVEDIDEPVARPLDVVLPVGVLLGVGDVELAAQILDVERGEAGRDGRVGEGAGEAGRGEGLVEDGDPATVGIGGVQEVRRAALTNGETLVDGAGSSYGGLGRSRGRRGRDRRVPAGDLARLCSEDEPGGAAGAARPDDEV